MLGMTAEDPEKRGVYKGDPVCWGVKLVTPVTWPRAAFPPEGAAATAAGGLIAAAVGMAKTV